MELMELLVELVDDERLGGAAAAAVVAVGRNPMPANSPSAAPPAAPPGLSGVA
jgi:hypothetical protein